LSRKHCLWKTCRKAETDCGHEGYYVVIADVTLEEAKKKYPDYEFCEDWEDE